MTNKTLGSIEQVVKSQHVKVQYEFHKAAGNTEKAAALAGKAFRAYLNGDPSVGISGMPARIREAKALADDHPQLCLADKCRERAFEEIKEYAYSREAYEKGDVFGFSDELEAAENALFDNLLEQGKIDEAWYHIEWGRIDKARKGEFMAKAEEELLNEVDQDHFGFKVKKFVERHGEAIDKENFIRRAYSALVMHQQGSDIGPDRKHMVKTQFINEFGYHLRAEEPDLMRERAGLCLDDSWPISADSLEQFAREGFMDEFVELFHKCLEKAHEKRGCHAFPLPEFSELYALAEKVEWPAMTKRIMARMSRLSLDEGLYEDIIEWKDRENKPVPQHTYEEAKARDEIRQNSGIPHVHRAVPEPKQFQYGDLDQQTRDRAFGEAQFFLKLDCPVRAAQIYVAYDLKEDPRMASFAGLEHFLDEKITKT